MPYKDDEQDREIKEKVNKMTMHQSDIDKYTLKHKHDSDLKKFRMIDEGY